MNQIFWETTTETATKSRETAPATARVKFQTRATARAMATGKKFCWATARAKGNGKKNFGQRQRKWQREKRCFQNPALGS